jgi:hypothetical protein
MSAWPGAHRLLGSRTVRETVRKATWTCVAGILQAVSRPQDRQQPLQSPGLAMRPPPRYRRLPGVRRLRLVSVKTTWQSGGSGKRREAEFADGATHLRNHRQAGACRCHPAQCPKTCTDTPPASPARSSSSTAASPPAPSEPSPDPGMVIPTLCTCGVTEFCRHEERRLHEPVSHKDATSIRSQYYGSTIANSLASGRQKGYKREEKC